MQTLKKTRMVVHAGTALVLVGLAVMVAGFFWNTATAHGTPLALVGGAILTMVGLSHRQARGKSGREFEFFFVFTAAIFFANGVRETSPTLTNMWWMGTGLMVFCTIFHRSCRGPSRY